MSLVRVLPGIVATVALAAGCASQADWSDPHPAPTAVGALAPGFHDAASPPAPESTIAPAAGSWDDVHPPRGYRVLLVSAADDTPSRTLETAVTRWASAEHVDLRTMHVSDLGEHSRAPLEAVMTATEQHADLVVTVGNVLVTPVALVAADHLDQQYLVVGAQLDEPTGNVTAAVWDGAGFRGDGLDPSSKDDPASFTSQRTAAALRAGVASVLSGLRGIVVWLR
ncbi:hypothetical protein ET471_11975 [Xylanimonas protaetiae]|uniref:BMP family ABC transporter substrate-binding protein n=1 Tax=Xylanimonas protaetiae TaxID=2509457 RepID=A0A4P6F803_9MICO|nr:hypothetical protein ET471_11975 [Xylanimonas protaetiae]